MKPTKPLPVKLFCGILFSEEKFLEKVFELLIGKFGKIDFQSEFFPFNMTNYYDHEIGKNIHRLLRFFQ